MPTNDRLKVVVRRLPASLPEPIFWTSVTTWVTGDTVNWRSFHPGKPKTRPDKESIASRAYIAFNTLDQVAQFSREYDGHVFRDKQGTESVAVVEFAPFQKIPQERKKVDARANTITEDDDFKSFVESLKTAPEPMELPTAPRIDPKSTPLLEALKAEKAALKDAAQIQSYHGHYHHGVHRNTASSSAKVAGKGKADDGAVFSRKIGGQVVDPTAQQPTKVPAFPAKPDGKHIPKGGEKPVPTRSKQTARSKARRNSITTATDLNPPPSSASSIARPLTVKEDLVPLSLSAKPAEKDRKRPGLNPRMFEAALAGVGAAATTRRGGKKAEASGTSSTVIATTTTPATATATPTALKEQQASPSKGASAKIVKRERGNAKGNAPSAASVGSTTTNQTTKTLLKLPTASNGVDMASAEGTPTVSGEAGNAGSARRRGRGRGIIRGAVREGAPSAPGPPTGSTS